MTSLPPPQPSPTLPSGPLAHYLTHPGAETARLLHQLAHLAGHLGLTASSAVAGVALVAAVTGPCCAAPRPAAWPTAPAWSPCWPRPRSTPTAPPRCGRTWSRFSARPGAALLGGQPHLGFELTATDAGLTIAWWVPGTVPPGLVERAIEAAWPGARTTTVPAGPPIVGDGVATGGELRLALPEHYPLRTEHKVDPLRPLLGALDAMGDGESACVQILARPVTGRRLTRLHKAAAARRSGRPAGRAARLVDLVTPGPTAQPANTDPSRSAVVADILDKAAQPCWAITVRYAVATTNNSATHSRNADRQATARLRGRAHAVASAFSLYAGRNRLDRRRLRHPAQVLAERRFGRGDLVSVAELAALAHLPTDQTVPGLARAGAKAVAPPPALARPAPVPEARVLRPKLLGDAQAGARRPVALAVPDARYHLHVMGATGSGKSTLLTNLVLGDVDAGRGVVVIDPKGDLITDLCDRLPESAVPRTVLIDPEDPDAAPVLNVLSGPDPDLAVDNLVGIFRSIFAAFWGPRTDDVLRAACLTLLRHAAATGVSTSLADVPRLLADDAFRAPMVATVAEDTVGLGGFWASYEAMSEASRAQVIGPLMNKLRAFLLRDFVRQVVGRPDSSFDMGRILDGGVCLVRVPKGILGEDTARLLGSFVVAKVWQTATHRARLGQAARVDASLVVDECQNFLHLPRSFDEMLAEARGYRLSMVLAHQHLGQLPKELRETVSANARTKVWFTMSPEDARPSTATSPPTSPSTTWPTSAPTPPPPASSSTAKRPPPSPWPPAPPRPRCPAGRTPSEPLTGPSTPGPPPPPHGPGRRWPAGRCPPGHAPRRPDRRAARGTKPSGSTGGSTTGSLTPSTRGSDLTWSPSGPRNGHVPAGKGAPRRSRT